LFNDHRENFDKDVAQMKSLGSVSAANTVCYRLSNGEMSKFELFGAQNDQFDNRFAYLASGDYSAATGDYAVMIVEKKGRSKKARIAWVHLN
jgi:hypothetical protein